MSRSRSTEVYVIIMTVVCSCCICHNDLGLGLCILHFSKHSLMIWIFKACQSKFIYCSFHISLSKAFWRVLFYFNLFLAETFMMCVNVFYIPRNEISVGSLKKIEMSPNRSTHIDMTLQKWAIL